MSLERKNAGGHVVDTFQFMGSVRRKVVEMAGRD